MATVLPARLLYVPKTRTEISTMSTIMATIFEGSSPSESTDPEAPASQSGGQDATTPPDLPPLPDIGIGGAPWPSSVPGSTPPPAGDQSTSSGDELGSLPPVPPDEALPPLEEPPDHATGERGQATGDSSREQPEGAALPQEPPLP